MYSVYLYLMYASFLYMFILYNMFKLVYLYTFIFVYIYILLFQHRILYTSCITHTYYISPLISHYAYTSSTTNPYHLHSPSLPLSRWLDRYSDRIMAAGTSTAIMYEAAKKASEMVPWYQYSDLLTQVQKNLYSSTLQHSSSSSTIQHTLTETPPLQRIKVIISNIEDWCIDYTYANPTLWVIARSGVWYRLAGILSPFSGPAGQPSDVYTNIYNNIHKLFLCASHVAYVLLDFLPTQTRITLKEVADEVAIRTKGEIRENFLLENYKLIHNQLLTLTQPVTWDKSISISKCLFITQLKRFGEIYHKSSGKFGLSSQYTSGPTIDEMLEVIEGHNSDPSSGGGVGGAGGGGGRKRKSTTGGSIDRYSRGKDDTPLPTLPDSIQDLPGWRALYQGIDTFKYLTSDEKEHCIALSTAYSIYNNPPYNDKEYYDLQYLIGNLTPSHPKPQKSGSGMFLCPAGHLGSLLHVWVSIANFRGILRLPPVTLSFLDEALFSPLPYIHQIPPTSHLPSDTEGTESHTTISTLPSPKEVYSELLSLEKFTISPPPVTSASSSSTTATLTSTTTAAGSTGGTGTTEKAPADASIFQQTVRGMSLLGNTAHPMLQELMISLLSAVLTNLTSTNLSAALSVPTAAVPTVTGTTTIQPSASYSNLMQAGEGEEVEPPVYISLSEQQKSTYLHGTLLTTALRKDETTSTISLTTDSDTQYTRTNLEAALSANGVWYDALRHYIAYKNNIPLPEYFDAVAVCEELLINLTADERAVPFLQPVDAARDGLLDYALIIRNPMDLGTILQRIRSGYYERDDTPTATTALTQATGTGLFYVNDKVDFFCQRTSRWYPAIVTTTSAGAFSATSAGVSSATSAGVSSATSAGVSSATSAGVSSATSAGVSSATSAGVSSATSAGDVTIRLIGFGPAYDESVPADSPRIALPGLYSRDPVSR